jgi:hypothetical protein
VHILCNVEANLKPIGRLSVLNNGAERQM